MGWSLMLVSVATAAASPIAVAETFQTSGTVGTEGVSGSPVVSFHGVDAGSLTTGTPFDFGQFVAAPAPGGESTTYVQTPFQILFETRTIDGAAPAPNATPIAIKGWLNGTVS